MNFSATSNIRPLTFQDIDQFRDIRLLALRTHPESFGASLEEEQCFGTSDWKKRISKPDSNDFVLGAYIDGQLVGVTGFFRQAREKLQHKGMIWGVFVNPEFRGKGIGRLLMEEALCRAETQLGLSVIQLCVAEPNVEAASLYRNLGFLEFGTEPYARKVNGKYISEIHMWRAVAGAS